MTIVPSLSPCPFCGSHVLIIGPHGAQHPNSDCILAGRYIPAREFREWNKRVVPPEARQLCSCTVEMAECAAFSAGYEAGERDGRGAGDVSRAAQDVLAERRRQVEVEGWAPEHDDEHANGQMAGAAACYALTATDHWANGAAIQTFWPWDNKWWKPSDRRRNLVKASALILAEIERLDRAALAKGGA